MDWFLILIPTACPMGSIVRPILLNNFSMKQTRELPKRANKRSFQEGRQFFFHVDVYADSKKYMGKAAVANK